MDDHRDRGPIEWQSPPLCCRYLLLQFASLPVSISSMPDAGDCTVLWAFGVLADGRCEFVGAWPDRGTTIAAGPEVVDELKMRGLEKVRFVSGIGPTRDAPTLRASYPEAVVLPSVGDLKRQIDAEVTDQDLESARHFLADVCPAATAQAACAAIDEFEASPIGTKYAASIERWRAAVERLVPWHALAPRLRCIVARADDAVRRIDRDLARAIWRRGTFPSEAAAASFVAERLMRAERDLGVFGVGLDARTAPLGRRPNGQTASSSLRL